MKMLPRARRDRRRPSALARAANASALAWLSALVACGGSGDDDGTRPDDPPGPPTAAQRAALPPDCLTAFDATGIAYCFSPADRNLMAVLSDGTTYWRYPLPGDNADNHVEGLVVAGDALVLLADVGAAFAEPGFEISRFERGGAFVETLPVLEPFERLRGDFAADPPAWDLDERDVRVVADDEALFVASSVHELIDGGDRSVPTDWRAVGSSIARIDALDGRRTAWRVLPRRRIESVALAPGDLIAVVTGGGVDGAIDGSGDGAADEVERRYRRADLAAESLVDDTPPLDPERLPLVLPHAFEHLRSGRLEELLADLEALHAAIVPVPPEPDEPVCELADPARPGGDCSGERVQGPSVRNCPLSGSVTLSRRAYRRFVSGTGASAGESRVLAFEGCELELAGHERLADGRYRLSGTLETSRDDEAIRQGSGVRDRAAFDAVELVRPDGSRTLVRGERRERATYTSAARHEKDVELESFESTRAGDAFAIRNLAFRHEHDDHDEPDRRVSTGGGLTLRSAGTADREIRMTIDPPLANLYWETDPVTLSGAVRLELESGDGVTVVASEPATFPGRERLEFLRDGAAEPEAVRPFECLRIPCF